MLTQIDLLPLIQAPIFNQLDWLHHGFGTKDITIEKYLRVLSASKTFVPKTHQPHGKTVHILKSSISNLQSTILEGDVFITDEPGTVCWVRTADCLPILIADFKKKVVGAVHSGWRGTAEKVILAAIEKLKHQWKTNLADLRVAFGPAICGRCYQVGIDVIKAFEKAGLFPAPWIEEVDRGRWHLDIAYANLHLLEEAGVSRSQVYFSLACTACDLEKFHSFRKERGKKGEQVSFILIK